jgi:hypothetical protein
MFDPSVNVDSKRPSRRVVDNARRRHGRDGGYEPPSGRSAAAGEQGQQHKNPTKHAYPVDASDVHITSEEPLPFTPGLNNAKG